MTSGRLAGRMVGGALVVVWASAVPAMAQNNGVFVTGLYISTLNRAPDPGGWAYWKNALDQGNSRDAVTNTFLYAQGEYAGVCPSALPESPATNSFFLGCLYADALHRAPDPGGLANWTNTLAAGYSRAFVVQQFIAGPEFQTNAINVPILTYDTAIVGVSGVETPPGGVGAPGSPYQFTFHYTDTPFGAPDIAGGQMLFNSNPNGLTSMQGCYVTWAAWGDLNLAGPYGNSYGGHFGGGPIQALPGTVCSLDTANSSLTRTASGWDVSVRVTLTAPAQYQVWTQGENEEGGWTGWMFSGSWNAVSGPPGFTVSATPPLSATSGGGATATISVQPLNGFNSTVNLSYDPALWPSTIFPTFGSFTVAAGGSTTVNVSVLNSTYAGSYTLPINASGGGASSTAYVNVVVSAGNGGGTGKGPRTSTCQAYVFGSSRVSPDLASGQVTGFAYTAVNYCAYYFGYSADVVSGLFKGSDEYSTDVGPKASDLYNGLEAVATTTAQSPDGDVYTVITDHFVNLAIWLLIPIDGYGNYEYSDPLGFSLIDTGGLGTGGTSGSSVDNYNAVYYGQVVYTAQIFLGATEDSASSSDTTPQVDSVSPSLWDPGTFPVAIQGSGFGASPTLEILPDDGMVHGGVNSTSVDGTLINAIITVDPGATPGNRTLSVISSGSIGLSFIQGPGKSKKSNPANVVVNAGGSPCGIRIVNDGQQYPINSPDYRTATFQLLANSQCEGTVAWTLYFDYRTRRGFGARRSAPYLLSGQLNQPQSFTTLVGDGGRGTVTADVTVDGVTTRLSATLYVVGTAIPASVVTSQLGSAATQYYRGLTNNILTGIASRESGYNLGAGQFGLVDGNGRRISLFGLYVLWPLESYDGGSHVGLMQVPTTPQSAWDWIYNTQQGAIALQSVYQLAQSAEATQTSACSRRGKILPSLTPKQKEQDGLAFYRAGGRHLYWTADPACTQWIKDQAGPLAYVDDIYAKLQ